jgi:hypothetical protein
MLPQFWARLPKSFRQQIRRLSKALEPPPEPDPAWDIPIDFCLRGAKALREHLQIQEQDYLFVAGFSMADCRAYVLYTALDEVKKTALYLMRQRDFFDGPVDPRNNRLTRLIFSHILEEQRARERRLLEVLVTLTLFTTTNDQKYYRHLLLLEDLDRQLATNTDLKDFHAAPSSNIEASIGHDIDDIRAIERTITGRTWYQKHASLPDREQLRPGGLLSSVRSRVKAALPLMTPQEKLLFGLSYAGYGAASEAVHYSVDSQDFLLQSGQEKRNFSALGLLGFAILDRCHELIGRPSVAILEQLAAVLPKTNAADTVRRLTVRDITNGDFVLAFNDLGEVVEIRESPFGYRSYKVRFLAEKPIPHIHEDWFPARFVKIIATRDKAIRAFRDRVRAGDMSADVAERFDQMNDDELHARLRQSMVETWEAGLRDWVKSRR